MDPEEENESTSVDILHPEILSKDDLIDLLSQRHIKLDQHQATKDDLIEIFHRTVTPLPQREPRSNRRGRAIAQVHKKLQAKRRLSGDTDEGSKVTLNIGFSKSGKKQQGLKSVSSPSSSPGLNRLKPPPIVLKQRTIKLNSSTTPTSSSVDSSSATVKLKKDKSSPATNTKVNTKVNCVRKKIVLDQSAVQSKSGSESSKATRPTSTIRREITAKSKLSASGSSAVSPISDKMLKISLKSSRSGVGSDVSKTGVKRTAPVDVNGKTSTASSDTKSKMSSPEEDLSPKKKIMKIAWP